jgi:hypothetical protein
MSEEKQNYVEEELDIDLGRADRFFIANDGNYFGIGFDSLFGQPELKIYNTFEMSSKRNFKNLASTLLETYDELFLNEEGDLRDDVELIFFNLLRVKSEVMTLDSLTYEKFISYMDDIMTCGDNLLIKIISDFVDSHYSLNLDQITEDTKKAKRKVNSELMMTDAHAKALLKIAYLYRVMIPIISVYFCYNKGSFNTEKQLNYEDDEGNIQTVELSDDDVLELEFDEVNSKIFAYLFEKFAENPEALRNKLYKLAYSGVSKTSYSDRRFWLAAKNVALTEKTEALEIYKKLLTNAIPKLSIDGNKNIVSFLQSVINNQVDFLFQNKFKYRMIPIGNQERNTSSTDDDEEDKANSDFEHMEILASREDEGSYIIRKINIKECLEKIPEKLNVGVSDAEVKDLMQKVKRNQIQEQIISLITFKYFEDTNALKFMTFYQYCYLLIACKKFLLEHKYVYLPKILTSHMEKHRERVTISGKKVKPAILRSKKYLDLVESKFANFTNEIEKPFLSIIGTVYSSVFTDDNGEEIFDSTVKVGKIAEELVDLAYLV